MDQSEYRCRLLALNPPPLDTHGVVIPHDHEGIFPTDWNHSKGILHNKL